MPRIKKTIEETESEAERAFLTRWIQLNTLYEHEEYEMYRERTFEPTRNWAFDFCWPNQKVALEIEGGTWNGGRHTRGAGFQEDCEKYNRAAELGWIVLRYTPTMIENNPIGAISQIENVIKGVRK